MAEHWHCTVSEAQAKCDTREYHYWLARAKRKPIGRTHSDLHFSALMCLIANMFKGKDSDSKTIGDFMRIFSGESKPEQSPDEMVAILNAFAAFQNANVRGG